MQSQVEDGPWRKCGCSPTSMPVALAPCPPGSVAKVDAHLLLLPVLFPPVAGAMGKARWSRESQHYTCLVYSFSHTTFTIPLGQPYCWAMQGHSDDHDSPGSVSLGLAVQWNRQTQPRTVTAQSLQGCGGMLKDQPTGVRRGSLKEGLSQLRPTGGERLQGGEGSGGKGRY